MNELAVSKSLIGHFLNIFGLSWAETVNKLIPSYSLCFTLMGLAEKSKNKTYHSFHKQDVAGRGLEQH